jgi:simple sugar transport system permease protein
VAFADALGPRRFLTELPALGGALIIWSLFAILAGPAFMGAQGAAAYLNAAAPLGIIAVVVALLMIGGEFDLSVGSTIGLCGMALMLLVVRAGWPFWTALPVIFALAGFVGFINGWLVVKTGLPSFLVTLAMLFVGRGLTIAGTRGLAGRTQLGGLGVADGSLAHTLFGSGLPGGLHVTTAWWIGLVLIAGWFLQRSRFGNWVFAVGGHADAARNAGVPVARVKITLFIATAMAAALVAVLQAVRYDGADALRGEAMEFRAIVAVVIGGTLLTGGYGTVLGAALGALIFGMVQQGIVLTGTDADWFQVLLGVLLLVAVLANHSLRKRLLGTA